MTPITDTALRNYCLFHLNLAVSGSISNNSRTGDLGTQELNFSISGSIMAEYTFQTASKSIPLSMNTAPAIDSKISPNALGT